MTNQNQTHSAMASFKQGFNFNVIVSFLAKMNKAEILNAESVKIFQFLKIIEGQPD